LSTAVAVERSKFYDVEGPEASLRKLLAQCLNDGVILPG
jgi:hypothetical protein